MLSTSSRGYYLRKSIAAVLFFHALKEKMVKYCVAAACSSSSSDGVSFFTFPSDPVVKEQWIRQVKRTRAHWNGPTSKHSVLCEKHFMADCFEPHSAIAASMGLKRQKRLKPPAVPTVFERPREPLPSDCEPSSSQTALSQTRKRVASTPVVVSKTKKSRSAYEKRERSRVRNVKLNNIFSRCYLNYYRDLYRIFCKKYCQFRHIVVLRHPQLHLPPLKLLQTLAVKNSLLKC